MSTMRVMRTAKATLTRTFYLDEQGTDATGAVTVAITRLDGTSVQNGTATGLGSGVYSFTFDGRDVLDELVVTWSATIGGDSIIIDQDVIQVVGGFYFSLAEARGSDQVFTNTTKYPTQTVIDKRTETEVEAEKICGQAFVPRFHREVIDGRGDRALRLKWPWLRKVRALSVDGVAWTADQLAQIAPSTVGLVRPNQFFSQPYYNWGNGNVVIEYEHGQDRPDPDLVRGMKIRFKSLMLETRGPVPDRTERIQTTEQGVVTLAIPSEYSTGIPTVDAIYAREPSPRPKFG